MLFRVVRKEIKQQYGKKSCVFKQRIDYSIKVAEHPSSVKGLREYAPNSSASHSYDAMAEEVLKSAEA